MENNTILNYSTLINDNIYKTNSNLVKSSYKTSTSNTARFSLTAKEGSDLFHYLKSFNLFKEPDILIIPPNQHFYYEENDFKNVRTLIILQKLNLIKDNNTFLQTLSRLLPPNINFIGCFSDCKNIERNSFISKLSGRFSILLDLWKDRDIDRNYVSILLKKYGFNIIDITEINGQTYFYSQNSPHNIEKRA